MKTSPITVQIEFVGPMRRPAGVRDTMELELAPDATVDDALAAAGYKPLERRALRVLRSEQPLRAADGLRNGDSLVVFLPVGGG